MLKITIWVVAALAISAGSVANAQDFVPPKIVTRSPGGVNLSDGSYIFSAIDLSIGPLKVERSYVGGLRDPNSPAFGPRTDHNFDIYVAGNQRTTCSGDAGPGACITQRHPIVHIGSSASGQFTESIQAYSFSTVRHDDDDSYKGELTRIGYGAYTYFDQDGAKYTFAATPASTGPSNSQRVDNVIFADGRRQDFLYDGSARLKAVIDSSGYALAFDYDGSNHVTAVCGFNIATTFVSVSTNCTSATLKATYGYNNGHLASVTNAGGEQTFYSWDVDRIACVSRPGEGCQVQNIYASPLGGWQVSQQNMADGAVWRYAYSGEYTKLRNPDRYADGMPANSVTVTNPAFKISTYSFLETAPVAITDENSNTVLYRFEGGQSFSAPPEYPKNFGALLMEVDLPLGNKFTAEYQAPRRAISRQSWLTSSGETRTQTFGYPSSCDSTFAPQYTPQTCAKPLWRRDAKNNQTDYSYTSFGSPEWEMNSAPTAGAPRPLTLYSYIQRYAFIQNGSGGLMPASSPIWLPASQTVCQTSPGSSSPTCDSNGPQIVTTYEYGPDGTANNLRLRGKVISADGTSRRTCYGYDERGNQVSVTTPRAGAGSCP